MNLFRVLLVEDEDTWQEILRQSVITALRDAGCSEEEIQLQAVGNYDDAKVAIEGSGTWDLLIADVTLDASRQAMGRAFGQILITLAHRLKLPTIVVSGTTTVWDVRNFLLEQGVKDCFSKEDFTALKKSFSDRVQEIFRLKQSGQGQPNKIDTTAENPLLPNFQKGYALLIGIADYANARNLYKTTTDARDFHDTLAQSGYLQKNIELLVDHQATKAAICKALEHLAQCVEQDDTVVLFFSGHGVRKEGISGSDEYLCPVETDWNDLENSCISSYELTTALRSIQARRLVVFLDACHSGGVGEPKRLSPFIKHGFSESTYTNFSEGEGRVIFSSCKADEVSWELPGMRNGLFTHYLLEGLRGGASRLDGAIPIMRLCDYVSDKVPQHRDQHPYVKLNAENFIVALSGGTNISRGV
jgi:hypothetical protein